MQCVGYVQRNRKVQDRYTRVILCLDRKERTPGQKRKHDGFCMNDCPFSMLARLADGPGLIRDIQILNHNHQPTVAASHKLTPILHPM